VYRRGGRVERGRLERAIRRDRRRPAPRSRSQQRVDARRAVGSEQFRQARVGSRERLDDDRGRLSPS
jgi:hypothetical protein